MLVRTKSSWPRLLTAAMIALSAAVAPSMFHVAFNLRAVGDPIPQVAGVTCTNTQIEFLQWDPYSALWGRRCVGSGVKVLSSEGDIVAVPSSASLPPSILAMIDQTVSVPALPPEAQGLVIAGALKKSTSCYDTQSAADAAGVPLNTGCDKGPEAVVCLAVQGTTCAGAGVPQVTVVDVKAPDTGGSVGLYEHVSATPQSGPAFEFIWDIARWAKGDVFSGLHGGVMKVYDKDFTFKRYVAVSDYARYGVYNDAARTLALPAATSTDATTGRLLSLGDGTLPSQTFEHPTTHEQVVPIGQLIAGCAVNFGTGNLYATNFDDFDPGLNVISRQPGNLSDPAHGDLPYSNLSLRISTARNLSTSVGTLAADPNGMPIDRNPESVKFDAQQNLYIGHSGSYSDSTGDIFDVNGTRLAVVWGAMVDDDGQAFLYPQTVYDSAGNQLPGDTTRFKAFSRWARLDNGVAYWENRDQVWANVVSDTDPQNPLTVEQTLSWFFRDPAHTVRFLFRRVLGSNLHVYGNTGPNVWNPSPTVRQSFTSGSGTDWIDLTAPDGTGQTTVFYTSEYGDIYRYNAATGQQLANLNDKLLYPGRLNAMRLLPPGDGTDLIVAGTSDSDDNLNALMRVQVVGGKAKVVQTYPVTPVEFGVDPFTNLPVTGQPRWYAIDVSPDGRTLWAAPLQSGDLYQFDVATGQYTTRRIGSNSRETPFDGQGVCIMWQYNTQAEICGNRDINGNLIDDDGNGLVDENCAHIPSTPQTGAPIANPDSYTTRENGTLTLTSGALLLNDGTEFNRHTLTAVLDTTVSNGDTAFGNQGLSFTADGSFVYKPRTNFHGVDTFTYHVTDAGGTPSNTVTVTIVVTPLVSDDFYTVNHRVTLQVARRQQPDAGNPTRPNGLLVNDSNDPLHVSAVGNTSLLGVAVGSADVTFLSQEGGTVVMSPDGSFTYTARSNFAGNDAFYYRANDGSADALNTDTASHGPSAKFAKVTIQVENTPPVAVANTYTTFADTPIDLRYAPCAGIAPIDGVTHILPLDSLGHDCVPDAAANIAQGIRDKNESGVDSDADGDALIVREWGLPAGSVPLHPPDELWLAPAAADPLQISACAGIAHDTTDAYCHTSHGGHLEIWPDGQFRYYPAPGFTGTDVIYYRVSDGAASSNWATVTFTVNPKVTFPAPVAYGNAYETTTAYNLDVHYPPCQAEPGSWEDNHNPHNIPDPQNPGQFIANPNHNASLPSCPPDPTVPNPMADKGIILMADNLVGKVSSENIDARGVQIMQVEPAVGALGDPQVDSGDGIQVASWGLLATDLESFDGNTWAPPSGDNVYVCRGMANGTTDANCPTPLGGSLEVWRDGTFRYFPPNVGAPQPDWFWYRLVDVHQQSSNWAQVTINVQAKMQVAANSISRPYGTAGPDTNGAGYFDFLRPDGSFSPVPQPIDRPANMVGTLSCTAWADGTQQRPHGTVPVSATTPAGHYPITCQGENRSGYQVIYVPGTLTITRKDASVTPAPNSKVYGANDPALTGVLAGFVDADHVAATYTRVAGETVLGGAYTISATLGPAGVLDNYTITYRTANFSITPAPLTVQPDGKARKYGDRNPGALTGSVTGIARNDDITAAYSTEVVPTTVVGDYPIAATIHATAETLSNYTVTNTPGNFKVLPRQLKVTAKDKSRKYGEPNPTLDGDLGDLLDLDNADTLWIAGLDGITPSFATDAVTTTPVGDYPGRILADVNPNPKLNNYNVVKAHGRLTITPQLVTITADPKTKVYGDVDPALTYQVTSGSLINGDTFSGSLTRVAGANVGDYAIQQGSVALSGNYTLTYVGANLSITPRPVTITADPQSKMYGNADPALTYKITAGSLVNGDAFSGALARAAGESVGGYPIAQNTVSLSANYTLTYLGDTLTIGPRPLRITANSYTRALGFPNPTLTGVIDSGTPFVTGGIVVTDGLAGIYTTTADINSPVGIYPITPSFAANPKLANYGPLTFVNGTLTVVSAPKLTLTKMANPINYSAVGQSITYTYKAVNSGNVPISGPFTVADDKLGAVGCGTTTLMPGDSTTCSAVHLITQADLDAGYITNKATVSGVGVTSDPAQAWVFALKGCNIGYPYGTAPSLTSVVFNESEVLKAFAPNFVYTGSAIKAWYTDEHALLLGIRQVNVKTGHNGTTTTNYPVTPLNANLGAINPSVGTTALTGPQSGTDLATWNSTYGYQDNGRPFWPALFITDITDNAADRSGDWQQHGTPYVPSAVFGTWKSAIKTVDQTRSPWVITVTTDADPAKNNWTGIPDVPLGGFDSYENQGYSAEVRWNADQLGLIPGHTYRIQVMVHDGDQNKVGGDVGQGCMIITAQETAPPPVADDDSYSTTAGTPLSVPAAEGVLLGDFDPSGNALTAVKLTDPANGTVVLNADGSLVYTPNADFTGVDSFTYKANNGTADSNVATVTITVTAASTGGKFTTYTQGGWGSKPNGHNPGGLLKDNFARVYPAGFVMIGSATAKYLKFTSAGAISKFLPEGGPSKVLSASAVDPKDCSCGTIGGQLLALQLNVDFSQAGITQPGLGALKVKSGKLAGYTVNQVLALANAVVGGTGALPAGVSISDLNHVMDAINRNFDDGKKDNGYLVQ